MFSLTTLGYFLGWIVGILGALVAFTVAKDVVLACITVYATKKFIDKYFPQEKDVIDVEAKFAS